MRVLSISRQRKLCGVSFHAIHVEEALEAAGVQVHATNFRRGLRLARTNRYDKIVVQQEIISSVLDGDLPFLMALLVAKPAKTTVVQHTVFDRAYFRNRHRLLEWPYLAFQTWLFRWISRRADLVVTTKGGVDLLRQQGIPSRYVPLGAYPEMDIAPRSHGKCPLNFAILGHPYAHKRYRLAAEAFKAVPSELRERARFTVVGGDPSVDAAEWSAIQAILAQLPPQQVRVTGALDDEHFQEALRAVDVALLPYEDKAIASAIVSNLIAAGVPAVVAPSRTFDDLVASGGALVAREWPNEATATISELIANPSKLETISTNVATMHDEYAMSRIAERLVQ